MRKEVMDQLLLETDPSDMYPIWIISYNRSQDWPTYHRCLSKYMDPDVLREKVNVVVRESQIADYRREIPGLTFHGIPDGYRGWEHSAGMARQASTDFAYELGHDRVIMLDDDILSFLYMFKGVLVSGKNAGDEKSRHNLVEDLQRDPLLAQHILTLFSQIAKSAFDLDPTVAIGSARKQNMSFSPKNHQTKFSINTGMTPRQMMVWDLERIKSNGITLDVPRFGKHGDDIGMAAQILQAGLSTFHVPTLAYHSWAEDVNIRRSVIRDAYTAPALHAEEFENLQHYEIGPNYLKVTKTSIIDGSYEWGDIDWRAYHKMKGTKPIVVPWDEDFVDLI